MKRLFGIILFSVMASLAGCDKSGDLDTTYTIRTWIEQHLGERDMLTTTEVWAAYLDTAKWTVLSYEDAVNRVATLKTDHTQKQTLNIPAEKLAEGHLFSIDSKEKPLMLLVYDTHPDRPMYAYADGNMTAGLGKMTLSILFRPLVKNTETTGEGKNPTIVQGSWRIWNRDDVKVEVECDYTLTSKQMEDRDSSTETNTPDMVAYLFYADTAQWTVTSYENAKAGILTSKTDPGLPSPAYSNMRVFRNEDGGELADVTFTLTESAAIFVLADNQLPMYGYGDAGIRKDNPRTKTGKMLFRSYLTQPEEGEETEYIYDKRWQIIVEPTPANP